MKIHAGMVVFASIALLGGSTVMADPVGIDGVIGADWAGVTPANVAHVDGAPESNFGTGPVNETDSTAYNIYVRDDGAYYYIALQPVSTPAYDFANLYLGNTVDGAFFGLTLGANPSTNDFAFIPGGMSNISLAGSGIVVNDSVSTGGALEVAIPNSFFLVDPLGIPNLESEVLDTNGELQVRDSQSFGYTYSGDPADPATRYGVAAIPEPASLGTIAFAGLGLLRRRRMI